MANNRMVFHRPNVVRNRIAKESITWRPKTLVSKGLKMDVIHDHRRAFEDTGHAAAWTSSRSPG
jgi:hypothetical protein